MKILFFLTISLTCIVLACSEKKDRDLKHSDLRTENIKGDVSQMIITSYTSDSVGNMGEMQDCCRTVFDYNEDGNLLKQTSLNKQGKITEVETTTIHENGLRTSVTQTRDGKRTRYMLFTVNDSGQYSSGKVLDSADRVEMYYENLVINEWGQPVSFTLYGKDSMIIMKEQAKYEGNKLISYFQADKHEKMIARFEYKYNDKGERIEEIAIDMTGEKEKQTIRRHSYAAYDKQGNWTVMTEWEEKGRAVNILKREFIYRIK